VRAAGRGAVGAKVEVEVIPDQRAIEPIKHLAKERDVGLASLQQLGISECRTESHFGHVLIKAMPGN
jgi:hypothetical protein